MTITCTPAVLSQNSLTVAEESKKSPNGVVAVFFGGRVPPCSVTGIPQETEMGCFDFTNEI